jgi:hypothetical protein
MDLGRPEANQRAMTSATVPLRRVLRGVPGNGAAADFRTATFISAKNCGACFHSCQYAPPHARQNQRAEGIRRAPSPRNVRVASALYRHQGAWLAIALAVGQASFLLLAMQLNGGIFARPGVRGAAYAVIGTRR